MVNPAAPAHTPAAPLTDVARLSFNQATAEHASLPDVIESCARHAVPRISIWRHKLAETGVSTTANLLRDAQVGRVKVARDLFCWFPVM